MVSDALKIRTEIMALAQPITLGVAGKAGRQVGQRKRKVFI